MTCSNCKNQTNHRRASQEMYKNRHGFCGCALQAHYVYMARLYERQCADFVAKVAA